MFISRSQFWSLFPRLSFDLSSHNHSRSVVLTFVFGFFCMLFPSIMCICFRVQNAPYSRSREFKYTFVRMRPFIAWADHWIQVFLWGRNPRGVAAERFIVAVACKNTPFPLWDARARNHGSRMQCFEDVVRVMNKTTIIPCAQVS